MNDFIGKYFLLILFSVLLSACATVGNQFDRTHVNDVKKGVQSKDEIKSWFGEPYQVIKPLNGHPAKCIERWTYVHSYASYGGAKVTSAALIVDFDKNGKVCDQAYSETVK